MPDTTSFEAHFTTHLPAFKRLGAKLMGRYDASAIDDLIQDACARALAAGFDPNRTGTFRAWFTRIMQNLFFDRLRKQRRRAQRGAVEVEQEISLDSECDLFQAQRPASALDLLIAHERSAQVARGLHLLPPEQRRVVELRRDGASFAMIARTEGIPTQTARTRYHYGIGHLQTMSLRPMRQAA